LRASYIFLTWLLTLTLSPVIYIEFGPAIFHVSFDANWPNYPLYLLFGFVLSFVQMLMHLLLYTFWIQFFNSMIITKLCLMTFTLISIYSTFLLFMGGLDSGLGHTYAFVATIFGTLLPLKSKPPST